jgi:RNA polymerase sigma factor (sigma-70 family)
MQPLDDGALLRQYAESQSDEAFAVLVARHVNLVYSVALRQAGNPHHAEEITQAVFIILARKAGQLRHGKALSSWLFQTTRLTANNFLRSERRRQHREQEAYMESTLNEATDEAWPQVAALLDPAVGALGEKDRHAIVLRFYEGRNLRDVGQALRASEAAAEKRVSRALGRLRKMFSKRGVTLSTTLIAGAVAANSVQAAPVGLAKTISVVAAGKGVAVGGSTLTLVKGALKLMAWTKAKTAVAGGAVILLAAGVTTVAITKTSSQKEGFVPGLWQSDGATPQGKWSGQELGLPGAASPSLVIQGSSIEFEIPGPGEWYEGTFSLHEDVIPKQLVFVITKCSIPRYVGENCNAIYQLRDGTLTLAASEPGDPAIPASFDAPHTRQFKMTRQ